MRRGRPKPKPEQPVPLAPPAPVEVIELEPLDGLGARPNVVELGGKNGNGEGEVLVRRRRRRRRRDAAIVGLMIAGLIGLLIGLGSPPGDPDGGASERSSSTTSTTSDRGRGRTITTWEPPPTAVHEAPPSAPALSESTGGVRLVGQFGRGVFVLDIDAHTFTPLDQSAGTGDTPFAIIPRGPGLVVVDGGRAKYYEPPFDRLPVELGPAGQAVEAAQPDQVWLITSDTPPAARLVSTAGDLILPPVELPLDAAVGAGVRAGLLVGAQGRIYLLDQGTRAFRAVLDGTVLGASGLQVVRYVCDDRLSCGIRIDHLGTGRSRSVSPPDGFRFTAQGAAAVFSPDGSNVAVAASRAVGNPGGNVMTIIDVATASATVVPEESSANAPFARPAWSPSGEWLFWVDNRVAAHHLGSPATVSLEGLRTTSFWAFAAF